MSESDKLINSIKTLQGLLDERDSLIARLAVTLDGVTNYLEMVEGGLRRPDSPEKYTGVV